MPALCFEVSVAPLDTRATASPVPSWRTWTAGLLWPSDFTEPPVTATVTASALPAEFRA